MISDTMRIGWAEWCFLGLSLLMLGCAPSSPSLPSTSLELRAQQTREFNQISETALLTAVIAVLQDLGYTIEESEKQLGIVTGSKRTTIGSTGEKVAVYALGLAAGVQPNIEHQQLIRITVVTQQSSTHPQDYRVRATFQREVWNTNGERTRAEPITRDAVYQDFFAKLSKAVFLEQKLA